MKPNSLLKKLRDGKNALGTWSMSCSRAIVEAIGLAGLDFVIIDMEHGVMSFETAEDLVRAAEVNGCQPIIRLGSSEESTILKALETGCRGLMIPHVSTPEQAEKIAKACKYAPEGTRGLSPYTRIHGFEHVDIDKSLAENNRNTFVGVLVEGENGIANIDAIASVGGIDMMYTGIFDISQAIGVTGQLNHPKVLEVQKKCVETCRSKGIAPGTFAKDEAYIREMLAIGYQFIAFSCDSYVIRNSYSYVAAGFRS